MKRVSIFLTAAIACSLMFVSWSTANKTVAAAHIGPLNCGIYDGDGGFYVTPDGSAVISNSGNGKLTCKAKDVPNSTGHAVNYNDFGCNTPAGATVDSHETVSASGNATLQCFVH